ncbi:MAG: MarR family transcriptional regulator [Alphaproteobacteria bacterium]|nr:MAG: MarR family transcriptional regulator [Alphaproteobacteria bacterium]
MRLTSGALEDQLEKLRDLEGRLTFRLSVLSKLLDQHAAGLLKDTPLNLTSYRLLYVVDTFGEISISDISRFTALDRAQISRTAGALARRGLVAFAADPRSRRKKLVRLTEKGKACFEALLPRFLERDRQLDEALGPEGREALWRGIGRLDEVLSR